MNRGAYFLLSEGPFLKDFDLTTLVLVGLHPFDILLGGKMIYLESWCVCVHVCVNVCTYMPAHMGV